MSDDTTDATTDEVTDEQDQFELPALPRLRLYLNRAGGITIESTDGPHEMEQIVPIARERVDWVIERLQQLKAEL